MASPAIGASEHNTAQQAPNDPSPMEGLGEESPAAAGGQAGNDTSGATFDSGAPYFPSDFEKEKEDRAALEAAHAARGAKFVPPDSVFHECQAIGLNAGPGLRLHDILRDVATSMIVDTSDSESKLPTIVHALISDHVALGEAFSKAMGMLERTQSALSSVLGCDIESVKERLGQLELDSDSFTDRLAAIERGRLSGLSLSEGKLAGSCPNFSGDSKHERFDTWTRQVEDFASAVKLDGVPLWFATTRLRGAARERWDALSTGVQPLGGWDWEKFKSHMAPAFASLSPEKVALKKWDTLKLSEQSEAGVTRLGHDLQAAFMAMGSERKLTSEGALEHYLSLLPRSMALQIRLHRSTNEASYATFPDGVNAALSVASAMTKFMLDSDWQDRALPGGQQQGKRQRPQPEEPATAKKLRPGSGPISCGGGGRSSRGGRGGGTASAQGGGFGDNVIPYRDDADPRPFSPALKDRLHSQGRCCFCREQGHVMMAPCPKMTAAEKERLLRGKRSASKMQQEN